MSDFISLYTAFSGLTAAQAAMDTALEQRGQRFDRWLHQTDWSIW